MPAGLRKRGCYSGGITMFDADAVLDHTMMRERTMNDSTRSALATGRICDITTTGRASGRPRRIEIWYFAIDGRVYLTGTPGPRDWYANLLAHPRFTFHVTQGARADLPARAVPVTDPAERRRIMGVVIGYNQWFAEQAQFEAQLEIRLQRRCIDDMNQHIGRVESNHGLIGLVCSHRRPVIAPEEVLDDHAIGRAQRVQGGERWQIDQRDLLQTDVNQAFVIGIAVTQQSLVLRRSTRRG